MTGESVQERRRCPPTPTGRIVTYDGVPAVTYYFSTSGGHTENVEFSFVGSLSKPWLVGVPDPYDTQSPYHRWTVRRPPAGTLDRALGAPGAFKRPRRCSSEACRRASCGHAWSERRGSRTVTGPQVRAAARPARHLVHALPRVELGAARPLGPAGELGPASARHARSRASSSRRRGSTRSASSGAARDGALPAVARAHA